MLFNAGTDVTLSGVAPSNNVNHGLALTDAPTARIGGSTVSRNGVGVAQSSGALETFQDNLVRGNTTNRSRTITAVSKG